MYFSLRIELEKTDYGNSLLKIKMGLSGITGHLWQGCFGSIVMDEEHLANAVRYVSLNPVSAKLG